MPRCFTLIAFAVSAVPLLRASAASACSVCGSGDPLVAAGDSMPRAATVRVALEGETLSMSARSDDDPALTESLRQLTIKPIAVYSPLDTLNLVLQLPVVYKDWSLSGAGTRDSARHAGLGDVDLGVRWFFWDDTDFSKELRHDFALSLGTSFPTGPNDAQHGGARLDDHAQLGTGSFGPYAGVLYAFHRNPWNAFASVTGRVHTTNHFGYRYGPAMLFGIGGLFHVWKSVAFGLGIDGRDAAHDRSGGEIQTNTGGLLLSAVPSLQLNPFSKLWIELRVQVPFYSHLYGVQDIGPTFGGRIQYSF